MWSQTAVKQGAVAMHQGKTSEELAYRVREHNKTSQTMKKGEKKEKKKKELKQQVF